MTPPGSSEWARRGVKVVGLSVDSRDDHARRIADIDATRSVRVAFPIIADKHRRVSMLFGMLDATRARHTDHTAPFRTFPEG